MSITAIVKLNDEANRIINIVKAKYGLKDKSQALNKMIEQYQLEILEPELRPEFIAKMKKIEKEKTIKVSNVDEYFEKLRKR
ncbi:MAG: DUF2683 family protein [Candidatus Diapherotrites archaeon]|nr:DUF2683 family protein [Candidatus Diapherotrites archaeon]